jgi:hypothetical protein
MTWCQSVDEMLGDMREGRSLTRLKRLSDTTARQRNQNARDRRCQENVPAPSCSKDSGRALTQQHTKQKRVRNRS